MLPDEMKAIAGAVLLAASMLLAEPPEGDWSEHYTTSLIARPSTIAPAAPSVMPLNEQLTTAPIGGELVLVATRPASTQPFRSMLSSQPEPKVMGTFGAVLRDYLPEIGAAGVLAAVVYASHRRKLAKASAR